MSATTANGKAITNKSTFSRETAVSITIQADASFEQFAADLKKEAESIMQAN